MKPARGAVSRCPSGANAAGPCSPVSVRHKGVPHGHLPHLPATGFVDADAHLNAAQWIWIGRGGFLFVVNNAIVVVIDAICPLVGIVQIIFIDTIVLNICFPTMFPNDLYPLFPHFSSPTL